MYQRKYYDEKDWETIDKETILAVFKDYYYDEYIALESMKQFPINTSNAIYRYTEKEV